MSNGVVYLGNQQVSVATLSPSIQEVNWGKVVGDIKNQTDLQNALDKKQNKLVPGNGVAIDPDTNEIVATARLGVTYWEGN
jgi:glutamine cyclotransferase